MSVYELTSKYVADGAIACRGGRIFVAFKRPGEQRNTLCEVRLSASGASLIPIGMTPGVYYKDGNCSLAFDDVSGELLLLNFCSPNASTGADARPVLWKTGIVVAAASGTVDSVARQQIADLKAKLRAV